MFEPLYGMALLTGLLGTAHCLGMCGGLVSALSLSPEGRRAGPLFPVLYHLGRLTTYGVIGLAVGWLGSAMALTASVRPLALYLLLASDLLVILMGFGTVGLIPRFDLLRRESAGAARLLGGATRHLRRFPPFLSPLLLGLVLGFLPCGLLYAIALTAAQSGAPLSGAGVMVAFGLGTAPGLLVVGGLAQWLGVRGRVWLVRSAGLLIVLMGSWNLWRHLGRFLQG
ncbi:MAG: sulfite exporter TauE/SafE family protein [Desulfuromonadales bacterium]|nr:sulfite exporter TauE/SafE family protein [Desulfuromonadales bacterium]